MRLHIPYHVAAMGLGLDAVIASAFFGLEWLGLGVLAIACGLFDGLRPRESFHPKQRH